MQSFVLFLALLAEHVKKSATFWWQVAYYINVTIEEICNSTHCQASQSAKF